MSETNPLIRTIHTVMDYVHKEIHTLFPWSYTAERWFTEPSAHRDMDSMFRHAVRMDLLRRAVERTSHVSPVREGGPTQ